MSNSTPVVFIGSGEASVLERKTLIYSIRKNTPGPVKIHVFNGTHNTVETEGAEPMLAPMPLRAKYQNVTEFSNYRFLIPQLCGFQGRAIWLDSDMVCFGDLHELFDAPMNGAHLLAKPFAGGGDRWELSAALFDCSKCRFDLEQYVEQMSQGLFNYNDLQQLTPTFRQHHPLAVGAIDARWNVLDQRDNETRLIHYTNLNTQPWKFRGHRHGRVWFRYFQEAQDAGLISAADVDTAIRRGYVRSDLRLGNTIPAGTVLRNALSEVKATLRDALSRGSA